MDISQKQTAFEEARRASITPIEFNMTEDSNYVSIQTRDDYIKYKKNASQQVIKCLKYHQKLQQEKGQTVDELDIQMLTKNVAHYYQTIKNSQYVIHFGHIFKLCQLEKHLQVCACAPKSSVTSNNSSNGSSKKNIEYELKEDLTRRHKSHTHGPKDLANHHHHHHNKEFKKRNEKRFNTHQPQVQPMNLSKDLQRNHKKMNNSDKYIKQKSDIHKEKLNETQKNQQQQLKKEEGQEEDEELKQIQKDLEDNNTSFDDKCEWDMMECKGPIVIQNLGINKSLGHFKSDESMPEPPSHHN